jgi:pyruvate-formate lyase-activating enzyme
MRAYRVSKGGHEHCLYCQSFETALGASSNEVSREGIEQRKMPADSLNRRL